MIYVYIVYIVYACVPVYHVLLRILPEILRREGLPHPTPQKKALKGLRKNLPWSPLIYSAFQNPTITLYLYIYIAMCFSQCQVGL